MVPGVARRGSHAQQRWPVSVMLIAGATGFLFVTAAVNARAGDLRPTGGDVSSLLVERNSQVEDQRQDALELRAEIDDLLADQQTGTGTEKLQAAADALRPATGLTEVKGRGLRVVLDDAPRDVDRTGIDPNLLVVHEQDIQAFVNALWAGGAEAISLQGQRLISTTGIKCVGNTVLLDGVPYATPYVIEAVGDVPGMVLEIDRTPETALFSDYSRTLGLGLGVDPVEDLTVPAYAGTVALRYADAVAPDGGSG